MFVPVDPDAALAYRALEDVLAVGCTPQAPGHVRPLVHAVLRSYLRALDGNRTRENRVAWQTFVRRAALLYFALNRHRERYADARWRQAALTLQQIALENADLLVAAPQGAAS